MSEICWMCKGKKEVPIGESKRQLIECPVCRGKGMIPVRTDLILKEEEHNIVTNGLPRTLKN